ncbi:MAG: 5'/3'-nucleotidase SurE, partial [Longimicrobiales bacterium]
LHHPLRARRTGDDTMVVDGTPTDCVILAVNELLERRPDFCLSGVNHGPNMGDDVLYSGTVAAAMEATVIGIPALAVSYTGDTLDELQAWGEALGTILQGIFEKPFPADTLFNINLPPISPGDAKGIRITSLGRRRYSDSLTRAKDPSGREYYWIGGGEMTWTGDSHSDFQAVEEGYVSVTPLHLDLTNYKLLEEIRGWDLAL